MPSASRVPLFLFAFTALFVFALGITVFALGITVASEFSTVEWISTVIRIGEGLGRLTFVSIAIAFILVEGVPLLAAWYKKQMEIKAREEGRASERKAWQAWRTELEEWERRRADAEREGRQFNEPRPLAPDAEQHSTV